MMALPEQSGDLRFGDGDIVLGIGGSGDVLEPGDAGKFFLHGGVRHDERVVFVAAERRLSLRDGLANDQERQILHANGLPDGILIAEEIFGDGLADEANFGGDVHIALRE